MLETPGMWSNLREMVRFPGNAAPRDPERLQGRRALPFALLLPALLLQGCGGSRPSRQAARQVPGEEGSGWSCVPYVRSRTRIDLSGDAWEWWGAAEGRYRKGRAPRTGAVMVFMRTQRLRSGHVSVVSRVVSRREIHVDHANWGSGGGKGRITRDQPVEDISPENDWSLVRVWYARINDFGQTNWPVLGFIYPS
jgi:hypothetical protein